MQILLLSNSTLPGQPYFEWPKKHIKSFLENVKGELLFIPYAGVTISFNEYYEVVNETFESLGYRLQSIHLVDDKVKAIKNTNGIIVGGGNTFHLLNHLYEHNLLNIIRDKVLNGTPFIGWSAGSNIAGPTIKTTNDMPIIMPPSFDSLDLVSFQINPHFTEKTIEGHGGESRSQRIKEYLEVNRESKVIGLPEGMYIEIKDSNLKIGGTGVAKLFEWKKKPVDLPVGEVINQQLNL